MTALRPANSQPWLIAGDFNLIYEARDKNNAALNRRLMGQFRAALNLAELKEIRCLNRAFSWSNERQQPTLVRLDRFFCNSAWEALFHACAVHALTSALSDHCPLLLTDLHCPPRRANFRFESFWHRFPGFYATVTTAWNQQTASQNPLSRLHDKMRRMARELRLWSKLHFSDARFQLHFASEIVLRFDVPQERRLLSAEEFALRKLLIARILGLAAIERARRRQASHVTWLRDGDANTRFFHLKMNARRRKNHIHLLQTDNAVVTSHDDKAATLLEHFMASLGTASPRSASIAWENLPIQLVDLSGIDTPFTPAEIWAAVKDLPAEKAPGPDGFNGIFYRKCWYIIREDIVAAFGQLFRLATGGFARLNSALLCLIPKRCPAATAKDYRPISLIHSFAKLFSKVLARRLAPRMAGIVSPAQSAFLKTRCIHENFLYVRNLARLLHRRKKRASSSS
jgi:hypothetical protein